MGREPALRQHVPFGALLAVGSLSLSTSSGSSGRASLTRACAPFSTTTTSVCRSLSASRSSTVYRTTLRRWRACSAHRLARRSNFGSPLTAWNVFSASSLLPAFSCAMPRSSCAFSRACSPPFFRPRCQRIDRLRILLIAHERQAERHILLAVGQRRPLCAVICAQIAPGRRPRASAPPQAGVRSYPSRAAR